ncbi:TRAP transporter small permease [Microbacterium sp. RD1]|uniref:TRAP transporter small permease n=1 Tax=Microbacterium sp. RD1 TaxID=3457313 RepID=UPI003FA54202
MTTAAPGHPRASVFETYLRRQSAVLGVIAAAALLVLMLATVIDVLVRWIARASVPGMLEVAESALVVSVFLGLAWTSMQGGHVAVSVVTDRLKPPLARAVSVVIWLLNAALLGWMTYASVARALQATSLHETRFGLVQWPVWPLRWVIALGLALWLVVALANVLRTLRGAPAYGDDADAPADV